MTEELHTRIDPDLIKQIEHAAGADIKLFHQELEHLIRLGLHARKREVIDQQRTIRDVCQRATDRFLERKVAEMPDSELTDRE